MSAPVFVVVGHPNKGKSSIVATLAQDDSVRIASEPGTTIKARQFPMRVDEHILYTLVDTPGFQRARRALFWLQQHETTAAEHAQIVSRFIEQQHGSPQFHDECELLVPIVAGGGILYVVDGAKPFGPEYEPEMEILRWTGQPSMALINPIGEAHYIDQWEAALGQYFKIVRVFNAMTAEFDKRLELLRAFGQLRENWREPMREAVQALELDRRHRRQRAAQAIAKMLIDMLTLSVSKNLAHDDDPQDHHAELERKFKKRLRSAEERCRAEVERIYYHDGIKRQEDNAAPLEGDLFSQETWHLFGQSKWRLAALAAAGGAAVGGLIDASLGGLSFFVGTAIGGAAGAALGWQAANWSANFQLFNLPGVEKWGLGGGRLQCGPTTNRNLPYVVLGRVRYHHQLIAKRTHARRDALVLDENRQQAGVLNPLADKQAKRLEGLFTKLRKTSGNMEHVWNMKDSLVREIESLLEEDVV